jgi:putative membrane protein
MLKWIKRLLSLALLLAVLVFGVFFTLQNTQAIGLDLLFIVLPEQYLALWVLSAFALGGIVGIVVSSVAIIQLRGGQVSLRRKLERREKELDSLRASPVK